MWIILIAALLVYVCFYLTKDVNNSIERKEKSSYYAVSHSTEYMAKQSLEWLLAEFAQFCMEEQKLYDECQELGIGTGEPFDENFFKKHFQEIRDTHYDVRPLTWCMFQTYKIFAAHTCINWVLEKKITTFSLTLKRLEQYKDKKIAYLPLVEIDDTCFEITDGQHAGCYNNLDPCYGWNYNEEIQQWIPNNGYYYSMINSKGMYFDYGIFNPEILYRFRLNSIDLSPPEFKHFFPNDVKIGFPYDGKTNVELICKIFYTSCYRDNFPSLKYRDTTLEEALEDTPIGIPSFERSGAYEYVDEILNRKFVLRKRNMGGTEIIWPKTI